MVAKIFYQSMQGIMQLVALDYYSYAYAGCESNKLYIIVRI